MRDSVSTVREPRQRPYFDLLLNNDILNIKAVESTFIMIHETRNTLHLLPPRTWD